MHVQIGMASAGAAIIDTSVEEGRVALLGTVASGKTTTCRYLARSWAAQEDGHCVVLTPRVHEYADLRQHNVHVLADLDAHPQAWGAAEMLIVDEAEMLEQDMLIYVLQSSVSTALVASFGPAVEQNRTWFTDVYALHWNPGQLDPVQARLDWPGAVDVFLDKRDRLDFPQHKWAI